MATIFLHLAQNIFKYIKIWEWLIFNIQDYDKWLVSQYIHNIFVIWQLLIHSLSCLIHVFCMHINLKISIIILNSIFQGYVNLFVKFKWVILPTHFGNKKYQIKSIFGADFVCRWVMGNQQGLIGQKDYTNRKGWYVRFQNKVFDLTNASIWNTKAFLLC